MYCWELEQINDAEDQLADLHICVDQAEMEEFVASLEQSPLSLRYAVQPFPENNPVHLDAGWESSFREYKSRIFEYTELIFQPGNPELIEIKRHASTMRIAFSQNQLEELVSVIRKSATSGYYQENWVSASRIIDETTAIPCRIIVWSGKDGQVWYY